ncbi:hypothetical protein OAK17_05860 [Alphaproteobacteria bacterium]|nr:hypothetical protein [Alphaproteobacteria bacterium]
MLNDQFNNKINTNNPDIFEALNNFEINFLGYKKNIDKIFTLSKKYENFLLFQLHSTLIGIFLDNPRGFKLANEYIHKSKKLMDNHPVTDREIHYYNFLSNLLNKKFFRALNHLDILINQNTTDLFFAKIGQIFYFSIGNSIKMKDLACQVIKKNEKNPYALSMLSFALEENNQIDKAKEVALKAINIDPSDPWSHHTLAHVFEAKNNPKEGINTLKSFSHYWNDCNSFIYTHNWWHIALFYLKINEFDRVFEIFNTHLWDSPNSDKSYSQDQAGAISLLIRLKIKNTNIEKEWEKISKEIIKRKIFFSDPFVTTHFAYVIGSIGNSSIKKSFNEEIELLRHSKNEFDKEIWQKSGIPLCKAMISHAEKNYQKSYEYFNSSKKYWHLVGGSHTQRYLFNILLYDAQEKL